MRTLEELHRHVLEQSIAAGPEAVENLIEEHANRRAEAATIALRAEVERLMRAVDQYSAEYKIHEEAWAESEAEIERLRAEVERRAAAFERVSERSAMHAARAEAVTAVARGLVEKGEAMLRSCEAGLALHKVFAPTREVAVELRAALARAREVLGDQPLRTRDTKTDGGEHGEP